MELMHQTAPYPQALADLLTRLDYRRDQGWAIRLDDDMQRDVPGRHTGESRGLTLIIERLTLDAYDHSRNIVVWHLFIVPAATYDEQSWQRWLFDRLGDVDRHERMEDFIVDGSRPYAPNHGPGRNPYVVHEYATSEDRRRSFTGELNQE